MFGSAIAKASSAFSRIQAIPHRLRLVSTTSISIPIGLSMLQVLNPLPDPNTSVFPFDGASKLAANKGLGGNQPTSLAIGPDGAAYFGNLKNNNLLRLPQPM